MREPSAAAGSCAPAPGSWEGRCTPWRQRRHVARPAHTAEPHSCPARSSSKGSGWCAIHRVALIRTVCFVARSQVRRSSRVAPAALIASSAARSLVQRAWSASIPAGVMSASSSARSCSPNSTAPTGELTSRSSSTVSTRASTLRDAKKERLAVALHNHTQRPTPRGI